MSEQTATVEEVKLRVQFRQFDGSEDYEPVLVGPGNDGLRVLDVFQLRDEDVSRITNWERSIVFHGVLVTLQLYRDYSDSECPYRIKIDAPLYEQSDSETPCWRFAVGSKDGFNWMNPTYNYGVSAFEAMGSPSMERITLGVLYETSTESYPVMIGVVPPTNGESDTAEERETDAETQSSFQLVAVPLSRAFSDDSLECLTVDGEVGHLKVGTHAFRVIRCNHRHRGGHPFHVFVKGVIWHSLRAHKMGRKSGKGHVLSENGTNWFGRVFFDAPPEEDWPGEGNAAVVKI